MGTPAEITSCRFEKHFSLKVETQKMFEWDLLGTGWLEMKHTNGFLLRAVLLLLCSTAKSIRITVNLRFVKGVFREGTSFF